MRLLVITQKIDKDDDVLGFMHSWLTEFSKQADTVTAVCLMEGRHALPRNVEVLSLGKESGRSRSKYVLNLFRYVWTKRDSYDAVFVHMNPEYVVLAGWLWKLLGKKVGLWYAHGHVPLQLRLAVPFADVIFTSTSSGCRIKSRKVRVVGQGIDTELFSPAQKEVGSRLEIVSVGRISPVKDYGTLIGAVQILALSGADVHSTLVGGAGLAAQEAYLDSLKGKVSELNLADRVSFVGPRPNSEVVSFIRKADAFANMSHTGSLDKAGLEAMSAGIPVFTCNEAFVPVLGEYSHLFMYPKNDAAALAGRISWWRGLPEKERVSIGSAVREIVVRHHSLSTFVKDRILPAYGEPKP